MSGAYNIEPQPTAKVVLQTTSGDLSLELFAKQIPLASRSFLQHCLDGYYNNTIFHRLVSGFILQGGDPTGTGSGGVSAINNGDAFPDEFHSRLKFNRRGLLGMANEGKDNNGSQFFLTLGATPELQGKHTMFGRIEGETIYNLVKMGDAELSEAEGSERPMYPTRITGAEVLVNPFEDMVARAREAPRSRAAEEKKDVRKRKKPAGKNIMSFGGDEDEEGLVAPVPKKSKANPKLVQQVTETEKPIDPAIPTEQRKKKLEPVRQSSIAETEIQATRPPSKAIPEPSRKEKIDSNKGEQRDDEPQESTKDARRRAALEKTNAEIAAVKSSMKRTVDSEPKKEEKPKSALEAMIPETSTRGRKRGKGSGDEKGALDIFKAFKARLNDLPLSTSAGAEHHANDRNTAANNNAAGSTNEPDDEEAELCDLHFIANCQSCKSWDDEEAKGDDDADGNDDTGWMSHRLTFAKDMLGKDLEWKKKMAEIEVIDPREKAKAIKEERRKGKDEARKR